MAIAANRYLVTVLPSGDTTQLMTVLNYNNIYYPG